MGGEGNEEESAKVGTVRGGLLLRRVCHVPQLDSGEPASSSGVKFFWFSLYTLRFVRKPSALGPLIRLSVPKILLFLWEKIVGRDERLSGHQYRCCGDSAVLPILYSANGPPQPAHTDPTINHPHPPAAARPNPDLPLRTHDHDVAVLLSPPPCLSRSQPGRRPNLRIPWALLPKKPWFGSL